MDCSANVDVRLHVCAECTSFIIQLEQYQRSLKLTKYTKLHDGGGGRATVAMQQLQIVGLTEFKGKHTNTLEELFIGLVIGI